MVKYFSKHLEDILLYKIELFNKISKAHKKGRERNLVNRIIYDNEQITIDSTKI